MGASPSRRSRQNVLYGLAFLAPNIIGFLLLTAGPVLLSFYMSFTNWSLKPSVELEWVGLRNYRELLSDPSFWFYLYNTFYFMLGIPFAVGGSLFLANLLVDSMKMKKASLRKRLAGTVLGVGFMTCTLLFVGGARDWALVLAMVYTGAFFGILFGSITYRTMFYIPNFASGVATIILWTQI